MAEVYDILLNDSMDLAIEDGDFVIGESTLQHQNLLLLADKGQFKQEPTIGVGIDTYLNDEISGDEFKRKVQEQLELDGMTIEKIVLKDLTKLTIAANYGPQDGSNIR